MQILTSTWLDETACKFIVYVVREDNGPVMGNTWVVVAH